MVQYSGVLGVEEPHQAIPNLVVKLYCGDDTVGEGRLIQNSDYDIPSLPLYTSEGTVLISYREERNTLSHLLNPKWLRRGKPWGYGTKDYPGSTPRALLSLPSLSSGYGRRNREGGRIPSPIVTKKLKETSKKKERGKSEEETDVEIETTSEMKGTKQEQEGSTEEDPSLSLCSEEKEDPDKIDEMEEIRVSLNGKEKTKDEFNFHLKETYYKNSPVYENSYLDGNQENSKL
ncbi:hypothetical protein IFM89_033378 [Coptis chinensis]|uniref:Uncharacterized protein n=1 Tax=Coptis chinensis TaxID=261450 RepID=A0A835LKK2_9MAGN|nr:hypothetical protein IFM89_033378 [Coptis chinensis]